MDVRAPRSNDKLRRGSFSAFFFVALASCTVDTSRLRAPERSDAASAGPSPSMFDGSAASDLAEMPIIPADVGREVGREPDDLLGLDGSVADAPIVGDTRPSDETYLSGETGAAEAACDSEPALSFDVPAGPPDEAEDAALVEDGPPDIALAAGGAGGSVDLPGNAAGGSSGSTGGDVTGAGGVSAGGAGGAAGSGTSSGSGGAPGTGGASATGGTVEAGGASAAGGTTVAGATGTIDAGSDTGGITNAISEFAFNPPLNQPWALAVGADNNLWIVERGSGNIAKFTIGSGSIQRYSAAPSTAGIEAITLGPDSRLWFTEYSANKIGAITTEGEVREYGPLPLGSGPDGIVAGPDGNLWFTLMNNNRIGRITPTGTINDYPGGPPGSQPARITVGPDLKELWFTEYGIGQIGHFTPKSPAPGPVGSYATLSPGGGPSGITAGPDGALWFCEVLVNKIGRITTTGSPNEYTVPTRDGLGQRASIAVGPDGNLWFTEYTGNKIGRITPTGTVKEFSISTKGSGPTAIVRGPDGKMWFTESDANQIGSIDP
jgi:virginiamycin B lyase